MLSTLLLALLLGVARAALEPKMLNGAPSSFAAHRVPAPASHAEREHSSLSELRVPGAGAPLEHAVYCDSDSLLRLSLFSEAFSTWQIELVAPDGSQVDLAALHSSGTYPLSDDGSVELPANNYEIKSPQIGTYTLRIRGDSVSTRGVLLAYTESALVIESHLTTYSVEVGARIGLQTRVTAQAALSDAEASAPLLGAVEHAELVVIAPDGSEHEYAMHDDGAHNDLAANDGVFGAEFVPDVSGNYVWFAQIDGTAPNGARFQRTTEHLVRVASVSAELTGKATFELSASRIVAKIGVNAAAPASASSEPLRLHAYAELWTESGKPVAWAASARPVVDGALELSWDARWTAAAALGAHERFELRHVYLSELTGFVPLAQAERIKLRRGAVRREHVERVRLAAMQRHDDEMHFGEKPVWLESRLATSPAADLAAGAAGALVLVHGYCSTDNPFQSTPGAWTGTVETFLDPKQSRSNDKFARLVDEFVTAKGITEWAGVGHSQGGIALTHLLCTYWSGMDATRLRQSVYANGTLVAAAPKIVQSVGTPYKGCSGAGTGASLISIFGYGCGANSDLTPAGATNWLASSVSEQCASHVYYYATKACPSCSACSFATSLVLKSPSDGTTEIAYKDLPGGNDMGVTDKQCHTTDMNYPAQTADEARNKILNKEAARTTKY